MRIAREEIFGPVLCVIPYEDEEHAIRIANDSDYGLAGTCGPRTSTAAWRSPAGCAPARTASTLYMIETCAPFGGYKASGIGRELGPEGLMSYLEYKSIARIA